MINILRRSHPFLLLSLPWLFFCSDFNNPYDSKSPNYVSDNTLVRYVTHTFIDTTIVTDTIIHVDTIFYIDTSIFIDSSFYIDTITRYDTLFDTFAFYDSIGYIDTITYYDTITILDTLLDTFTVYDSVGYIDTLHVFDTTVYVDTTFDTVTTFDTLTVYDTLTTLDTLFDSVAVFDTTYDTISVPDTVWTFDTIIVYDTTHVTVYDTVIVLDTLIDTIFHYNTDPFIYWITLPDSNPFTSFVSGSTYTVGWEIKGINPSLVQSFTYKPPYASVWNNPDDPFTRSFTGPDAAFYYLRAVTDSGTFVNPWTVGCDPASLVGSSSPSFKQVRYRTLTPDPNSFDTTYFSFVPVCTLFVDSAVYTEFPDRIGGVNFIIKYDLSGCSRYDIYFSDVGSYDTSYFDQVYDDNQGEIEIERDNLYTGTPYFTSCAQCVSPDTSAFSPWTTYVFIVRNKP